MWASKLRDRRRRAAGAPAADLTGEFPGSDPELLAEIARLSEANRAGRGSERERRLLHLRNLAGIRRLDSAGPDAPAPPEADLAALPPVDGFGGLPEIATPQLTPELLRAGILRDGCVLVRDLVPRAAAVRLAEQIELAFEHREHHDAGEAFDPGYYAEFAADPRVGGRLLRPWVKEGGGLLAVDSPMLSFELGQLLEAAGMPELVAGYLGEPPLIAAQKTTLRKAEPSVAGAWHQDGKFMGDVRALNLWLSLSRCGDVAPGLDIVPRRIDRHVRTQTDEAWLDHAVSQRIAEAAAGETPILRPIFEPGDALLFDELFLHKTGSDPAMPNPRFAVESWFFGAGAFPHDYVPLSVSTG